MINYLFRVYNWLYNETLKEDFIIFDFYNPSFLNEEGMIYPALFLEIEKNDEKYLQQNVVTSELHVIFHVISESYGSLRDKDKALLNTIEHYRLIENVARVYDSFRKDLDIIPTGLTSYENYLTFGIMDRYSTETSNVDGIFHSKMTFRTMLYDQTANYTPSTYTVPGTVINTTITDV